MLVTQAVVAIGRFRTLGYGSQERCGHQRKHDYEGSHGITPSSSAEEGRCGLSGSAQQLESRADARPALPPCFTEHTEGRSSRPGKTVRLVTRLWNINCHSDLPVWRPVSRARLTGSAQLVAVSRHEEGPGETARGLRWSLLVLRLTLRREISEPDEARAATVHDGNRPAETGRACRSARRERLVPTGLERLADRVRARRQTREQVVARGVGRRGRIDRTADRYAPALEAGPR